MKKAILILINLLCICNISIYAQQTVDFELIMPAGIVDNSRYNRIQLMDELEGREDLGYVLNSSRYKAVIDQVPLAIQLDTLMQRITDATAGNSTLLLQLRDLNFAVDGNDHAFCHIRINLYEEDDSGYRFISIIDTTAITKHKEILNEASYIITSFITDNLTSEPLAGAPYTLDEIRNITSFEKSETPLYTRYAYEDGIYPDFYSFVNQQPQKYQMQHKVKNDELKEIKILNTETNKWVKVKPQEVYAVAVDGKAYVSEDKKFYRIYRDGEDFKFIAEKSAGHSIHPTGGVSISTGNYGTGFGGGIGIVIGPKKKERIEYMIDHLNGDFIYVGRK